ncbi:MAG: lipoate--protein ligase family protein [Planctomycetales bacterium]|nr:lipoate--protein ligase family protein [Planctomycetales bacterium]
MICRLILDEPRCGAFNMAADEWLLRNAPSVGCPTLRFYFWSSPTLSLGYFQKYADRAQHSESVPCAAVRRASGGGAILHHHELTYSYITPIDDRVRSSASDIYDIFHDTLIETLATYNIHARKADDGDAQQADNNAFLCFTRRSIGDVVMENAKIAGSAQRRHANALVQHGSVLLSRSEFAPQLPGIGDITSVQIPLEQLIADWSQLLSERQNLQFDAQPFTDSECDLIQQIVETRFGTDEWQKRR